MEALDRAIEVCGPGARPGMIVAYARHFEHYLRSGRAGVEESFAALAPAPFQDDGGEHFVDLSPGRRVTPSGKNACVRCGEAWPCSTELQRQRA